LQKAIARHQGALERYEGLCRELGAAPADIALAWLVGRPGVSAPIIGPRTLDQLEGAVRALELTLDRDTLARLDEIWPGPGGEAPEAYAW
jgi:aryl-alcohol dehydrogenase-like predicted oxidoreductase